MVKISIIAYYNVAARLFLYTPFFKLLQQTKNCLITIYTIPTRLFKKEFNFSNVKIRRYKYLHKLDKSDIILLPDWTRDDTYRITKFAQKRNIPTLFVQEGAANPSGGYPIDVYPAKLAVWGEIAKETYVNKGIDPDRVIITGQPRFDYYYEFKSDKIFKSDKKTLLYMTHPLWKDKNLFPEGEKIVKQQYDGIYKAAKKLNTNLVCKMHPGDKEDLYKKLGVNIIKDELVPENKRIRGYNSNGYMPSVESMLYLAKIINSSDIVSTIFSTTALEAMILDKPTILFDKAKLHNVMEITRRFVNENSFAYAKSDQEFEGLLDKYLKEPTADKKKREEVIRKFAYKIDGRASQRVYDLMISMIGM